MAETNRSAAINYYIQARRNGEAYPIVPRTLTRNYPEKAEPLPNRDPWDEVVMEVLPLTALCGECGLLPRQLGSGECLRCWLEAIQPVEFEG